MKLGDHVQEDFPVWTMPFLLALVVILLGFVGMVAMVRRCRGMIG